MNGVKTYDGQEMMDKHDDNHIDPEQEPTDDKKDPDAEIYKESKLESQVTEAQWTSYNDHLQKEIAELDVQFAKILGDNWESSHEDKATKVALDVREACRNKIYTYFATEWYPSNDEYKEEYKKAVSCYCMGWGVLMDMVILHKVNN